MTPACDLARSAIAHKQESSRRLPGAFLDLSQRESGSPPHPSVVGPLCHVRSCQLACHTHGLVANALRVPEKGVKTATHDFFLEIDNMLRSPASDRLDCPPGIDERTAPSVGGDTTGSGESVSRQLSESGGIVCPPAGIDAGIVEQPPSGGTLRIIPPAGSPGGDQSIMPK